MKVYATIIDPIDEEAAEIAYRKAYDLRWDFNDNYAMRDVWYNDQANEAVEELRALGFTVEDYFVE